MKQLLLTAAMALGLAATTANADVHGVPVHGVHGIHGIIRGIPIRHCWPHHYGRWCHHGPIGRVVGHPIGIGPPGVHGLIIRHPVGVAPNHGFPNGVPPEQRVEH
jgi:hypothetical protein